MQKPENGITGIYKITSPSGKVYIGKSKNILSRYYKYFHLRCEGQRKIYGSLKKYGPENHIFDIIEECDVALLIEREIYHKTQFINEHTWNKALFCHLVDGESGPHTQTETSNKMRSKSLKEYWEDKTHPLSGRPLPPNVIEKRLKPVLQYSLDGDFIRDWESQLDVYNSLQVDIIHCLKNKYRKSGGFQWKYKESTIPLKIEPVGKKMERTKEHSDKIAQNKIGKGLKPIFQLDMDGNIIKEWESQSQASIELNIPISGINLCLNGKSKTSKGYKWMYKK
jgi:group I intron endonuclease